MVKSGQKLALAKEGGSIEAWNQTQFTAIVYDSTTPDWLLPFLGLHYNVINHARRKLVPDENIAGYLT